MLTLNFIPVEEFRRIQQAPIEADARLALLADMCRVNAICAVKRAGSGHLGSSFSAMDLVVWLYYERLNVARLGIDHPDRDVYFSSKGHDVPGLYAVLCSRGLLPLAKLLELRRLGGLDGHPDVGIPGIEANTGSLGMGISKARGMAWAKRHLGRGGHVYCLLGDGELQEGQIFEALQTTAHQKVENLTVIVDHNRLQSDRPVAEIIDLRDLAPKFRSFGWHVARCNGHDYAAIRRTFDALQHVRQPKLVIADTIKGRGVSFMEHPQALRAGGGLYRWHAGAPDDAHFEAAQSELLARIETALREHALPPLACEAVSQERAKASPPKEFVADAVGETLVEMAADHPQLVVLDGDLSADCRIRGFETGVPQRFIENGIAEQDMVSMAGGLASQGLLPVVNTFASFLAARANEQIYNNATERTKVIYAAHYAGLIPAGPGKSHQSIRDIALLAMLPNMTIVQPCNRAEARMATRWAIDEAQENCTLRLTIGPCPRSIELPADYRLTPGRGVALTAGHDAILFAYGPVMLHEALTAAERLAAQRFGLKVVNMPWLNRIDGTWLAETVGAIREVYVLEDHAPVGGLGDRLLEKLVAARSAQAFRFTKLAVEGFPACGTPQQALRHHGLDGESIALRLAGRLKAAA